MYTAHPSAGFHVHALQMGCCFQTHVSSLSRKEESGQFNVAKIMIDTFAKVLRHKLITLFKTFIWNMVGWQVIKNASESYRKTNVLTTCSSPSPSRSNLIMMPSHWGRRNMSTCGYWQRENYDNDWELWRRNTILIKNIITIVMPFITFSVDDFRLHPKIRENIIVRVIHLIVVVQRLDSFERIHDW